jgi:energy-coupling factor transport system permease protein
VRGYGGGARPPRRARPWSRHDLAFTAAAVGMLALGLGSAVGGWETFEAYPRMVAPVDRGTLVLGAALVACAFVPFFDRRGIGR